MSFLDCDYWFIKMQEELKSMHDNDVWGLVDLPDDFKPIVCKCIFKLRGIKEVTLDTVKPGTKGLLNERELISTIRFHHSKDSFRILMALVAHFNFNLHQMDVKIAFFNAIYLKMSICFNQRFKRKGKEHAMCRLNKSLYSFKQASIQWFLKFNEVVTSFGFKENVVEQCILSRSIGVSLLSWYYMLLTTCLLAMIST